MASLPSLLDSIVSEEIECAICLHNLETPRILSCLHSFCENCLEKFVKGRKDDSTTDSLKCPLCKEYTAIPAIGVRGLRLDFRAARLVEALNEKDFREKKLASSVRECDSCHCEELLEEDRTEKTSFVYCRECCQILCQRCSTVHAGLRLTQSHSVANVEDVINGKVTIKSKDHAVMCPKHVDERLKLFCVTCLEPICHDCTLIDHSRQHGHNLQFLKDFIPTIRDELSRRQEKLRGKSEEFSKFITSIDQMELHIMDQSKSTTKTINEAVDNYTVRVGEFRQQTEKVACNYFSEKTKQLLQLREETEHIRSLAEKSLSLTQKVLGNEYDMIGVASIYKSLQEASDRSIYKNPDKERLASLTESVDRFHYHVTPLDARVGKVNIGCSCKEIDTVSVPCNDGPSCVQFTPDGGLAAIVGAESADGKLKTVYFKNGQESLYTLGTNYNNTGLYGYSSPCNSYSQVIRDIFTPAEIKCPAVFAAIKQTATSFPNCSILSCTRWLQTLKYESIRCFVALSGNRFLLATSDAKLHLLGNTLTDFSHGLPVERSITGLATDSEDNIYVTDQGNCCIYILRSDGYLDRTLDTKDLSPIGVAVAYRNPQSIVITHEPTTVSILELTEGTVLHSLHKDVWNKISIACGADDFLYILWSDVNNKKTLQRFTMQGLEGDFLFENEVHSSNATLLAVCSTGTSAAAVVSATGKDGEIVTYAPKKA